MSRHATTIMSDVLTASVITASATITAALIAWLALARTRERASSQYRRNLGLINPQGRWKCDWFNEDGSLYVSDVVEIEGWVENGRFKGRGVQPKISYAVQGEIDNTRALALTYRAEDFPRTAYVGVVFLTFNVDGDTLSGRWYGRIRTGEIAGGKTEWRRNSAT